jgi:micrococcal nuclease
MKTKICIYVVSVLFLIFSVSGCVVSESPVVTRVIDGDTIEVDIEGELYRVRYIGIDTPEMDDERPEFRALAQEATNLNRRLVAGESIRLEKDISENDRYGRLLRYVYVDGVFVNAELVRQGLAWSKTYEPDVKYQGILDRAEAEAKQDKIGIWQEAQP